MEKKMKTNRTDEMDPIQKHISGSISQGGCMGRS